MIKAFGEIKSCLVICHFFHTGLRYSTFEQFISCAQYILFIALIGKWIHFNVVELLLLYYRAINNSDELITEYLHNNVT